MSLAIDNSSALLLLTGNDRGLPKNGLVGHYPMNNSNMLKWSNDPSNAAWTKGTGGVGSTAPTVTANYGLAPDGTMTAHRVQFNAGTNGTSTDTSHLLQSLTTTNPHRNSGGIWMKTTDGTTKTIRFGDSANSGEIDCTVTGTWQFFSRTSAADVANASFAFTVRARSNLTPTADILIWKPQVNTGSFLLPYEPTTDQENIPNEVSGFNIARYSDRFDNATTWPPTRATVTTNVVQGPFDLSGGPFRADKLICDATPDVSHIISQTLGTTFRVGDVYTASVYLKAAEFSYATIRFTGASGSPVIGQYVINLTTGAITPTIVGSSTCSVVDAGNGWWRASITGPITTNTSLIFFIYAQNQTTSVNVTGNVSGNGIYMTAAMANAGSVALNYERTIDIGATQDPSGRWGYHAINGGSLSTTTNNAVLQTGYWDPDATDDFITIPLHMVDVDEFTILSIVRPNASTSPALDPAVFAVRYDGSTSKYVSALIASSTSDRIYGTYNLGSSAIASPSGFTNGGWPDTSWGLAIMMFNRATGLLKVQQVVAGVLQSVSVSGVSGLSTPDVARLFNRVLDTARPMDGGGSYSAIYTRALSDAEVMRAYYAIKQAKSGLITL